MSYSVKYSEKRDNVEVNVLKIVSTDLTEELVTETVKLARKNKCNSFLFDARNAILKADIWATYKLFALLDKMGFKKDDKIVLLIEKHKPLFRFAETVAVNRGWNFLSVDNEEEAQEWLQTQMD